VNERIHRHQHHGSESEWVAELVAQAAHYLPAQAPIHAFVHHNTLHAFEDLPFDKAVVEAAALFSTDPFPSEEMFKTALASGRILVRDIDAALDRESLITDRPLWPGALSQREFWRKRVQHLFEVPSAKTLRWQIDETDLLRDHGAIWQSLEAFAPLRSRTQSKHRQRDRLLDAVGFDCDAYVHPLLIRLTGAFLDQGVSYWPMPDREDGFLAAVRRLYGRPGGPPDPHFQGLADLLCKQENESWNAETTIAWALNELGHAKDEWPLVVRSTLLALPGWAGMMHQFELTPEKAPVQARAATLVDFLAVRLILECVVLRYARTQCQAHSNRNRTEKDLTLVYEALVVALALLPNPETLLDAQHASRWMNETAACSSLARRRILHHAFERRHRIETLDALLAHNQRILRAPETTTQIVFCIDDREESYRRHVEEIDPSIETFGYPGFFGVAMSFQGARDIAPRALCPVVLKPTHFVVETEATPRRSMVGRILHHYHVGRSTLVRGALISITGIFATLPLTLSVLSPRLAAYRKPKTNERDSELHFVHDPNAQPRSDGLRVGYTFEEMADIVAKMLVETGLKDRLKALVLLVGHGSTSVNNPHIAAYGCGATAGGSGGANARVLAAMANRPETRAILRERGFSIPEGTWFVGGLHNTCTDDVVFFDETKVPASHREHLSRVKDVLNRASVQNAHERCRLFGVVPIDIAPDAAKRCVESRSVDLSEARPEYNHTKNSMAIIGQRKWTRGLFLDKRAFLVSYDPKSANPDGSTLTNVVMGSVPVGVGINLEYLFSLVDNHYYGSGTKLPHNITGLLGVMDGHASDLRTGLYHQMVEIHEPVRMLGVIEASPEMLLQLMANRPAVDRLVRNEWLYLAAWDPERGTMHLFEDGEFRPYTPESTTIKSVSRSQDVYTGTRNPLPCVHVQASWQGGST
jgi:uncharacterized protein YbcC (UPF0753/DUF2309 family)